MHIIRQQYLYVEVNGTESDGLALQHSLPGVCRNFLTPAIERAFERGKPPDGHHLYIERLEIDVGTLMLDRVEHDLAELVAREIEKSLRAHVCLHESSSTVQQLSPRTAAGEVQLKSAQQATHEAFIYFLNTGMLPWSFRLPEGKNLEQAVLDSWRESARSGDNPDDINDIILQNLVSPAARKRLVRQFPPVFLKTLLSRLSWEGKEVMDRVLTNLRSACSASGLLVDITHIEHQLWEAGFSILAAGEAIVTTSLISESRKKLGTTAQYIKLMDLLEDQQPGSTSKPSNTPSEIEAMQSRRRPAQDPVNTTRHLATGHLHRPPQDPVNTTRHLATGHLDAAEGIYIENAGIVLLHPFLPQFFETLGISAKDKLLEPERALCLLHFLATGQSIAPEYELMLPKILCNISLENSVESGIELTDAEKEEGTALLEAVIRHWGALRSTSPDSLRGTFFIRPGKISLRPDDDWVLQVETNSYDILMDSLPWSISMIKLPWMARMLWVEWR